MPPVRWSLIFYSCKRRSFQHIAHFSFFLLFLQTHCSPQALKSAPVSVQNDRSFWVRQIWLQNYKSFSPWQKKKIIIIITPYLVAQSSSVFWPIVGPFINQNRPNFGPLLSSFIGPSLSAFGFCPTANFSATIQSYFSAIVSTPSTVATTTIVVSDPHLYRCLLPILTVLIAWFHGQIWMRIAPNHCLGQVHMNIYVDAT